MWEFRPCVLTTEGHTSLFPTTDIRHWACNICDRANKKSIGPDLVYDDWLIDVLERASSSFGESSRDNYIQLHFLSFPAFNRMACSVQRPTRRHERKEKKNILGISGRISADEVCACGDRGLIVGCTVLGINATCCTYMSLGWVGTNACRMPCVRGKATGTTC
jgi:hypothetical protein